MASLGDNAAPSAQSSGARPRPEHQRGGRGRGRGRANPNASTGSPDTDGRPSENRGGRRGRGGNKGANHGPGRGSSNTTAADHAAWSAQRNGQGENTTVAAREAGPTGMSVPTKENEDSEAEVCFICASTVVHHSVAPCNHRTCHICALRMRALYKTKDCAHCRTESAYVIFTDDANKKYQDFIAADLVSTDENIGIKYENTEIVEDTLLLLRYNCPDPSCDVACLGWPDLHRHVRGIHHKKMCDLCTRNKKVFTHEHELFTDKELHKHMTKGDDNPGAIDQSGFKGHPLCGFCGERFYGDDELYVHCRAKHERCFICDRRDGRNPQYYLNYDALEEHFRKDHFICLERECMEKKFIVFPSEMDLKAHQLQEHGNTLSKDVRRDARVVNLSSFDYRAPYIQERHAGGSQRENRGRGRGRDPNAEPIPASSAQPMRRDEQAFQRQLQIHSAQSVSTRNFGGQLTAAPTPTPPRGGREPPSMTVQPPSTDVDAVAAHLRNADLQDQAANLSPQDQARRLRHSAVIERATALLGNDQLKLTQFRNAISSYRTNAISAAGLIDAFFALFSDTSSTALGSLVREVADLYEDKTKAQALRTAWNDWRAINEDYPSLPGPSGMNSSSLPQGWAQVTASTPSTAQTAPPKSTSRVLKLKSSTAQSSRSSVSRTGSWGVVSSPAAPPSVSSSSAASAFPNLSGGPTSRVTTTPWVGPSSSVNPSSTRPTASASRQTRGSGAAEAFPSLPPAPKPTSTIFGYGTGMVRRDTPSGRPSASAWTASGASGAEGDVIVSESDGQAGHGKRKGNKGKKQVLVQWG